MRRKICVLTGTRADYGLLYWLMKELLADSRAELQIIATGMHLSSAFGMTVNLIENDGFFVNEKVDCLVFGDSPVAIAKSIGLATGGIAEALHRLSPDLLVILGDRYEALAGAQAAMVLNIPIAHIHGGESTEGAMDEAIRHSITKMSHLHFVAAEEYRRRVIQLGEQPSRVFNVGATGIDNIKRLSLFSPSEVAERIPVLKSSTGAVFLVTYHPVTLSKISPADSMKELLSALDLFPDARIVMTKANADTHGSQINTLLDDYGAKNKDRVFVSSSLGQKLYLSVLSIASAVIGNSSSGIIEAPAMKVPTLNVGPRQEGRAKASSVVDVAETSKDIVAGIQKCLSPEFREQVKISQHVYGEGNTSSLIKDQILMASLDGILVKRFFDIPVGTV